MGTTKLLLLDSLLQESTLKMPGLKKLKKGKKFNYGRNRSRVRKQQEKTSKFNVALKVDCQAMKEVWDTRVSLKENMTKMGVAFDANNVVPKISSKMKMVKEMKKKKGMEVDDNEKEGMMRKSEVIARLEDEAKFEAKQTFRFTPTQVQLISYMMDKHGEDWPAMVRDPKNHYQETAAKLRGDQVHLHPRTLCCLLQREGTYPSLF